VSRDEAAIAHHEAGHAVAAVTFRRSIVRVSIEPDQHSHGRLDQRPQRFDVPAHGEVPAWTRRAVNADIVVAWAGPLAEERVAGGYDHETAEHDLDRMFDQAMSAADRRPFGRIDHISCDRSSPKRLRPRRARPPRGSAVVPGRR
jgi:hypothetical protein